MAHLAWAQNLCWGKLQAEADRLCGLYLIKHDQRPGKLLSLGLAPE